VRSVGESQDPERVGLLLISYLRDQWGVITTHIQQKKREDFSGVLLAGNGNPLSSEESHFV
jgi:hypothetical protein